MIETRSRTDWHAIDAMSVAAEFGVELERGLDVEEVRNRQASVGPNRLVWPLLAILAVLTIVVLGVSAIV